jgi:PPOX class probable F420-dependent enzyme
VRTNLSVEELGNALSQPWLAVLATKRKDGSPLLSPVWFEWEGSAFLVGVVRGDAKETHIRRDPRVGLCIAEEATYPGRVCEAWGEATLEPDPGGVAMRRIAARYLGASLAERWIDQFADLKLEWELMRLEPERIRALDHRDETMLLEAQPTYLPEPQRTPVG